MDLHHHASLELTKKDFCRVCGVRKKFANSAKVCSDEACKITDKLILWQKWVLQSKNGKYKRPKGMIFYKKVQMGLGFSCIEQQIKNYAIFIVPETPERRIEIVKKLQEVRGKLSLLSECKTISQIKISLDKKRCNLFPYTFKFINYEQQKRNSVSL
jgi:hypothetical protein